MLSKLFIIMLLGIGSYMILRNKNKPIHDVLQAPAIKQKEDFRAVTSLAGFENFYVEMRRSSKN